MSILITGMEMPKNCAECPCRMIGYTKDHCNVLGKFIDFAVGSEGRREDCPLIEVPEHGDLIERDYVKNIIGKLNLSWEYGDGVSDCWNALMTAPTVIPADKDGET